jgi:hypothetical protein
MARTVITIRSDLFDNAEGEEASVRENLPIRTLIAEICKEFDLPEATYILRNESGKALEPDKTLEQSNIRFGAMLVFSRERRSVQRRPADYQASQSVMLTGAPNSRTPIAGTSRAFLRETDTGEVYDIQWQPAIIGRPDVSNPSSAEMLAVNVGRLVGSQSVSRQHARLTELGGQYYLEALAERNPTFLNEGQVRIGEKRLLQPGDKIRVGTITFTFGVKMA